MRYFILCLLLVGMIAAPIQLGAETPDAGHLDDEDFELKTTQDLVDVCAVETTHPLYQRAIDFCLGYATGAIDYHMAISEGEQEEGDVKPIICLDDEQEVERYEVILTFLDWAKANQEFMEEPPVEGLFRALMDKWPCKEQ